VDLGRELALLRKRLEAVERAARLSHASLEDTALQVYDGNGSLRGLIGVQGDGTTAVNIVNGPPPPQPSTPTVAPALGGIAVGWDGAFADGVAAPLDWSRVEVHASATDGFTPGPDTLQATIETPQGAICYVPVSGPVYVRLLARNTSGTASAATAQVGPYAPRPVAGDIGIGEITETMINDGAVTTPKIYANAVTTAKLAVGSVDATALAADAITGKTITGGTVTGAVIQTATSGERITLNEDGANKVIVYNSAGVAIGELSGTGLIVKGSTGAVLWLNPNATYPQLLLYNAGNTSRATVQVVEPTTGDANLEMFSGRFTGNGYTDMVWRTYLARDYAVTERVRGFAPATVIGGRLYLDPAYASLGFKNTDNPAQNTTFIVEPNLARLDAGRLQLYPPASSTSALFVEANTVHTGNLLRLYRDTDRFLVDKDGNATIAGNTTVGGSLTVAGVGQRQFKRRSSDLPRASTTTLAADTQLTFTVDANSTYVLDGFLVYSGPGDFFMGWSVPAGTAGLWTGIGNGGTVVSANGSGGTQTDAASTWGYTVKTEAGDLTTTRSFGGVGGNLYAIQIRATVRVGATAGTLALTWSQGVSNATPTTLYTDSHLRLEKVA
jgi:hypothetical protein